MYIINVTFLQLNLIKAFANVRILLYINSTTDKSDDTHIFYLEQAATAIGRLKTHLRSRGRFFLTTLLRDGEFRNDGRACGRIT